MQLTLTDNPSRTVPKAKLPGILTGLPSLLWCDKPSEALAAKLAFEGSALEKVREKLWLAKGPEWRVEVSQVLREGWPLSRSAELPAGGASCMPFKPE